MPRRYLYAAIGVALGLAAAAVMALPVLVVGQFALKADHSAGPLVRAVSCAVVLPRPALPPSSGSSWAWSSDSSAPSSPMSAARGS